MMQYIQSLSISMRLLFLLAIAAVGTMFMVVFMVFMMHDMIQQAETDELNAVNQTLVTLIEDSYQETVQFGLSDQQAQQQLLARLAKLETTGEPQLLILSDQQTILGRPVATSILTQLQNLTVDDLHQQFSDSESNQLVYASMFIPWNWTIVSYTSLESSTELLLQQFWKLAGFSAALSVPLLLVFVLIIRSITLPLNTSISAMQNIAEGEGDLTLRLPAQGKDELSRLGAAFNSFVGKIQQLVQTVQRSAADEEGTAIKMKELTYKGSDLSMNLSSQTTSSATAIEELAASAAEVAEHARHAADSANQADIQARQSADMVHHSVTEISNLTKQLAEVGSQTDALQQSSAKIGTIVNVIMKIAEQTNLLALNAAIEAARAGDAGRGFAVVADEVRQLASSTQQSTNEINTLVNQIQAAVEGVSRVVENVRSSSSKTSEESAAAEQAISKIRVAIEQISGMNAQIASATDEQSRVTQEVSSSINLISQLSENNEDNNQTLSELGKTLISNSKLLNEQVKRFTV